MECAKGAELITLLIALALISTQVFAGDYSDAVQQQIRCDNAGELASLAFDLKKTRKSNLEKAYALLKVDYPGEMRTYLRGIVKIGFEADDNYGAHMTAWAACMDEHPI